MLLAGQRLSRLVEILIGLCLLSADHFVLEVLAYASTSLSK